jgi:hypothetical protein
MAGPNETPVLEARIPGTDKHVAQHPKDEMGSIPTNAGQLADAVRHPEGALGANATVKHEDGTTQRGADAMVEGRERAKETGAETAEHARDRARSEVDDVNRQTDGVPETDEEKDRGKRTIMDKMRGYRVSDIHMPSRATVKRTIFLERSSSSFMEEEDHDTLPGPFASELGKVQGVTRLVGGIVAQGVGEIIAQVDRDAPVVRDEPQSPAIPPRPHEFTRLETLRRALVRLRGRLSPLLCSDVIRHSVLTTFSFF